MSRYLNWTQVCAATAHNPVERKKKLKNPGVCMLKTNIKKGSETNTPLGQNQYIPVSSCIAAGPLLYAFIFSWLTLICAREKKRKKKKKRIEKRSIDCPL